MVVTLPVPPANLTVDYAQTTFYHWPQMTKNLTEDRNKELTSSTSTTNGDYANVAGSYFLFKEADQLDKEKEQVRFCLTVNVNIYYNFCLNE